MTPGDALINRIIFTIGIAVLLTIGASLAFCSSAHAAEAVAVDLTGIATATIAGIFGILGIVIPMIIQAKIKNKQMADLLTAAVKNSLGKIQQATVEQVRQAEFLHPTLPANLAIGAQYVADHAPEALAHFGITPEAVADKVEAAIGLKEIENNIAVSASAAPVVVPPLASSDAVAAELNRAEHARHS
jgi:hypothetical protein